MTEGVTMWFPTDIHSIQQNPHRIQTPFGFAQIVGTGDVFAQRDALEEAIETALGMIEEDHEAYRVLLNAGKDLK